MNTQGCALEASRCHKATNFCLWATGKTYLFLYKLKGAQSRFAHIEKFSLNFSNSSFVIRVNLLHP